MTNPIDHPELYDSIVLAGVQSPGTVTLSGHESKVAWDVKAGSAQQGASMSIKSLPPVEFTATFELIYDPTEGTNEIDDWDAFQKLIDATVASASPKAADIYHPDLARVGIKRVAKASVGGMTYPDEKDRSRAIVAVKFQEYVPPRAKGGTAKGSAAKPKGVTPDPNQDLKNEIARLTTEYQNTPWG